MSVVDIVWNFIKDSYGFFIVGIVVVLFILKERIFNLFKRKENKKRQEENALFAQHAEGADRFSLQDKKLYAQKWIDYTIQKATQLKAKQGEIDAEILDLRKKHDYYETKLKMLEQMMRKDR